MEKPKAFHELTLTKLLGNTIKYAVLNDGLLKSKVNKIMPNNGEVKVTNLDKDGLRKLLSIDCIDFTLDYEVVCEPRTCGYVIKDMVCA